MPLYFVILLFLSTFKKFQADIVDVNTIFKDLATMVHEQGEMVDSIEANVESAQMRVEEGTTQLGLASTYQVCRYISIIYNQEFFFTIIHRFFIPVKITQEKMYLGNHYRYRFGYCYWHHHLAISLIRY